MDFDQAVDRIGLALERVLQGRPFDEIPTGEIPEPLRLLAERINALMRDACQMSQAVRDLARGKMDLEPLPRTNIIAGGIKQLHANLMHLTWQTQQIAMGDYSHSVDYLGDFSDAFNQMTEQLREREARLTAGSIIMGSVLDHIESMFIVDARQRDRAYIVNQSARERFQIPDAQLDLSEFMRTSPLLSEMLSLEPTNGHPVEMMDGDSGLWYSVIISALSWHGVSALLVYCTDITDLKQREAELRKEALTDPLTGIANRRQMHLLIDRGWPLYQRLQLPTSILIVDVDLFKRYNDTYGHMQGDVCLHAVAQCMRVVICRSTDILARYGGEEFLALLPNTNAQSAQLVAERLRAHVEALVIPKEDGSPTRVTCSVGVACFVPANESTVDSLIAAADQALYRAKAEGRNRVVSVAL